MSCAICGRRRNLEHVNVNVVPAREALAKRLGIEWGDHSVVVLCRPCLAEIALTEEP